MPSTHSDYAVSIWDRFGPTPKLPGGKGGIQLPILCCKSDGAIQGCALSFMNSNLFRNTLDVTQERGTWFISFVYSQYLLIMFFMNTVQNNAYQIQCFDVNIMNQLHSLVYRENQNNGNKESE